MSQYHYLIHMLWMWNIELCADKIDIVVLADQTRSYRDPSGLIGADYNRDMLRVRNIILVFWFCNITRRVYVLA